MKRPSALLPLLATTVLSTALLTVAGSAAAAALADHAARAGQRPMACTGEPPGM